jgi:preprotein translocase subunit SecE
MDIKKYINEVRSEMNKVSWPSRERAVKDSVMVIVASVGTAIFIGGMDAVFSSLTQMLISK